eukprot:TRINITY_DN4710_c0_g1_i1.p1 TRINITY_DN4710_c0_g1~~TRINITY_DN4710_c0_g1_i1.p1  ORF type:complete len:1775 (+),score=445.98 TRINITY_DN4710_c0_g1_i1:91-5415(+)
MVGVDFGKLRPVELTDPVTGVSYRLSAAYRGALCLVDNLGSILVVKDLQVVPEPQDEPEAAKEAPPYCMLLMPGAGRRVRVPLPLLERLRLLAEAVSCRHSIPPHPSAKKAARKRPSRPATACGARAASPAGSLAAHPGCADWRRIPTPPPGAQRWRGRGRRPPHPPEAPPRAAAMQAHSLCPCCVRRAGGRAQDTPHPAQLPHPRAEREPLPPAPATLSPRSRSDAALSDPPVSPGALSDPGHLAASQTLDDLRNQLQDRAAELQQARSAEQRLKEELTALHQQSERQRGQLHTPTPGEPRLGGAAVRLGMHGQRSTPDTPPAGRPRTPQSGRRSRASPVLPAATTPGLSPREGSVATPPQSPALSRQATENSSKPSVAPDGSRKTSKAQGRKRSSAARQRRPSSPSPSPQPSAGQRQHSRALSARQGSTLPLGGRQPSQSPQAADARRSILGGRQASLMPGSRQPSQRVSILGGHNSPLPPSSAQASPQGPRQVSSQGMRQSSSSPSPNPTPRRSTHGRNTVSLYDAITKMRKAVGGDDACVTAGLNGLTTVCSATVVQQEVGKWLAKHQPKSQSVSGGSQEIPKYGDGIASAKAPEQVTKLLFYAADWTPPRSVEDSMEETGRWWSPRGPLWPGYVADDLMGNCNLMQRYHADAQPPSLVLPLFVYSVSVFYRRVWVAWTPARPGDKRTTWTVLKDSDPLDVFREKLVPGEPLQLDARVVRSVKGLPQSFPLALLPQTHIQPGYALEVFYHRTGHVLCRYANKHRGDQAWSPTHDTTLWLPTPSEKLKGGKFDFVRSLDVMPPPGIIEYLHSRRAEELIDWPLDWVSRPATGTGARRLVAQCLDTTDQQKYSSWHDAEFQKVLADYAMLVAPRPEDMSVKIIPEIPPPIVVALAREKAGEGPSPQSIAHALDIQWLYYAGRQYLLALSGSRHLVADIKSGQIVEVWRLKDGFDDQPYWHLNAAMRNKQFNNEKPKLTVSSAAGPANAGEYICDAAAPVPDVFGDDCPALPTFTRSAPRVPGQKTVPKRALYVAERGWTVLSAGERTLLRPGIVSLNVGTWLLPQVLPLLYYLDRALEQLRDLPDVRFGGTVRAGPQGIKNFRGLAGVTLDRNVYDTGKVVLWGQFSSSSKDRGVAAAFAQSEGAAAVFTLLGKGCVCIAQWSRFAREHEWLYPPNSMFKVTACLSEEHQQILDKTNLQLFSMEEVSEYDALEIFVRGLVPRVQGEDAPEHVMQLFQVVHSISSQKISDALQILVNPAEPALYTPEGQSVAKRLLALGGARSTLDESLLVSCAQGYNDALSILIELGGQVEAEAPDGRRALHVAASRSDQAAVAALLAAGADPTSRGAGFTAIEWAALRRDHALVEQLRPHSGEAVRWLPRKLEDFKPRVQLQEAEKLRTPLAVRDLPWAGREQYAEQQADVVLFDRKKDLYWLKFADGTTDMWPDGCFVAVEVPRRRRSSGDQPPTPKVPRRQRRRSTVRRQSVAAGDGLASPVGSMRRKLSREDSWGMWGQKDADGRAPLSPRPRRRSVAASSNRGRSQSLAPEQVARSPMRRSSDQSRSRRNSDQSNPGASPELSPRARRRSLRRTSGGSAGTVEAMSPAAGHRRVASFRRQSDDSRTGDAPSLVSPREELREAQRGSLSGMLEGPPLSTRAPSALLQQSLGVWERAASMRSQRSSLASQRSAQQQRKPPALSSLGTSAALLGQPGSSPRRQSALSPRRQSAVPSGSPRRATALQPSLRPSGRPAQRSPNRDKSPGSPSPRRDTTPPQA